MPAFLFVMGKIVQGSHTGGPLLSRPSPFVLDFSLCLFFLSKAFEVTPVRARGYLVKLCQLLLHVRLDLEFAWLLVS